MAKFSVGEVAVIAGAYDYPELVGAECTIKSTPYIQSHKKHGTHLGYAIILNGDQGMLELFAPEHCLRKKQPPEKYTDQFTPADKSFKDLMSDWNKAPVKAVKEPDMSLVYQQIAGKGYF
jgi:hypothetical protein